MILLLGSDSMEKLLFDKIKEYKTIIIHRHSRPDLDALGSQLGLAYTLKNTYPDKNIYVVGDVSRKYSFIGNMNLIEDKLFEGALSIICDVAVSYMVSDDRYKLSKEVFVIDHHKNECDITENHLCDTTRVASCEYLVHLLLKYGYTIPKDAATCFYAGIVTDSGRFLYGENLAETLTVASKLISFGAECKYIFDHIYVETLEERQMKNYFSNRFEVKQKVAFLKNDSEVFHKFSVEFNDISRGMLSVMSGIKEIEIWLNFTYDISKDKIIGEFRSRSVPIVDIAKKYGGCGHLLACGATLDSWDMVDLVINDFIELLKLEE